MLGPYRVPGPVEPDFPARCTDPPRPAPCRLRPLVGPLPPLWAKALAGASTLFLLTASASLAAITTAAVRSFAPAAAPPARTTPGWVASAAEHPRPIRTSVPRSLLDATTPLGAVRVEPWARKGEPSGLEVTEVSRGSAAEAAGLRTGDVILSVNGVRLLRPEHAVEAFAAAQRAGAVDAELIRDGGRVTLRVEAAADALRRPGFSRPR